MTIGLRENEMAFYELRQYKVLPGKVDDADWADYLFYRTNPRGVHAERWLHAHGCQRWFNMLRDTASDQVIGIYAMGESRPDRPKT